MQEFPITVKNLELHNKFTVFTFIAPIVLRFTFVGLPCFIFLSERHRFRRWWYFNKLMPDLKAKHMLSKIEFSRR